MPDGFSIDAHELQDLAASLMAAAAVITPALVPVANKAGVNIKKRMKADASGHRHLPGLARTVNYDVETGADYIEVEVGFEKKGQGNLANIAAFGTSRNGPVMDITLGLKAEVPSFTKYALKVAAEAIK